MFLSLKCLKCRISFLSNILQDLLITTYLWQQHICCVRPQSTVKDAWHQRSEKLFPPNQGPLAPLLWVSGCTNPLCNFSWSTVTSRHVTFRTFVWNLEPAPHHSFIMSAFIVPAPVDLTPPVYRHYVRDRRRK